MMGHSHAVSGALLFAGTAPYVPPLVLHTHLAPQEILMGTVLCAGAALLPDLDHHDGTIANFLGPASKVLCRFVAWISGGHRHATHSLFFVILMTVGSWAGITYLVSCAGNSIKICGETLQDLVGVLRPDEGLGVL
ncbi:metal-dependent hydrolase, partial [Streptomyces sp. NPDC056165]|uniref:metal-dependent hydrolase n=1 Tax=Streptomyces sp. NPDC056165 TaxID=3345733 RepID=UPI0035D6485C